MTLFVTKGDAPLTPVQLEKRAQKYIKRSWPDQAREKSIRLDDGVFDAFMSTFSASHTTNVESNTFNWQLAEYRKASSRLDRIQLSVGRPAYEEPTGEVDENGDPIMWTVPAIEPLVGGTVEVPVYDDDGNQTGTETQPDADQKSIDQDDAERAVAQAVVDATPQEVLDF